MSEERKEILRMVADRVITVDDAERLLRALAEGERREESSPPPPPRGHRRGRARGMGMALGGLGEALAGIGPMVRAVVEDAVSGLADATLELGDDDEEGLEAVDLADGRFRLEPGAKLVIRNDRRQGQGGGDLILERVEGEECELVGEEAENLRVFVGERKAVVRWAGGLLRVRVPASVRELKAMTLGGDIEVMGVPCEQSLKTMGGGLYLREMSASFKAKTMGGGIDLSLAPTWRGSAKATSMGGTIQVQVPRGIALRVEARTMGGTIDVPSGLGRVLRTRGTAKQKVELELGEGDSRGELELKTMGGDIRFRELADEA
jgi:hypothetical protein